VRVGIGYDVHRLAPNCKLVLGGVEIPFDKGLIGWSDADVLVHAIIDALLGAAGLGDIGRYFPPGGPEYKDVSSLVMLEIVKSMLSENNLYICNIDSVIVAEQPKLADYRDKMCQKIAKTLKIPQGRVNIKANTSEEMGFVGREEGMASWATALLESGSVAKTI